MNMTFRISYGLIGLLLTVFISSQAMGDSFGKSWIRAYQSESMKFIPAGSEWAAATPGRHPVWAQKLINQYFAYEPWDQTPTPLGDCDLFKLREAIRQVSDNRFRNQIVQKYRSQCASYFHEGPSNSLQQALKVFSMKYDVDSNPFFHRIVFFLPDGQKLKAVLAMKDLKKRPLVIVRAGITGNVEEAFAERFFLYDFFERGLFNVLLVENMTSTDYIHYNRRLDFGGLTESYQNIWLAQTLTSPSQPFSRFVQSVHLVGLSLGGQGVLTAAWLARYQKNPKLFSSFMAFCPLVNTTETFDYLFKKSWLRFPLEVWAHSRFKEYKAIRPDLFKSYWGLAPHLLSAVAQNYHRPPAALLGVKEPWFVQRQNNNYYSLHELSRWDPTLRDPVWIWVTDQDPAVPVRLNTGQLQLANALHISEGEHCSFPVVWDNRVFSTILNGYIMGSSRWQVPEKQIKLDITPSVNWQLGNIQILDGASVVQVELTAREGKMKKTFSINRSDLDFQFRSAKLSPHEVWMVKRWLATNLHWQADTTGLSVLVSWPMVK